MSPSAVERPLHRSVCRPFGDGRRKSLSSRFADILKGRTAIAYDPQDLTTMYQDAAGTLPVYRPGTGLVDPPVGLMLDRSQGLELGPELFDDAGVAFRGESSRISQGVYRIYSSAGVLSSINLICLEIGKTYNVEFSVDNVGTLGQGLQVNFGSVFTATVTEAGIFTCILSAAKADFEVKRILNPGMTDFSISNISVREIKGYHAYQTTTTARPTLSGRYSLLTATETLSTQSVTTAATDYTLKFEGAGTITLSGTATGVYSAGTHTIPCTAGTLTCTVAGTVTRADLRVKRDGSTLPAYQSVTNANTYDTTGFPLFLKRDRADDNLIVQAPAITGQTAWGSIDTVDIAAATIAAGAYKPFGEITAGEPTCTQWIAINGTLTAAEQAILERYVYSKSKLPVGA